MICSRLRNRLHFDITLFSIAQQEFPLICGILERVKVVRDEVIEEAPLDLASEDVDF